MSFGEKLKKLRENKNLTQKELAELLSDKNKKYTQRIISYYEREERGTKIPSNEILERVSSFFNVSINYLIDVEENKSPELQLLDKIINLSISKKIEWSYLEDCIVGGRLGKDYYNHINDILKTAFIDFKNKPNIDNLNEQQSFSGYFDIDTDIKNYELWLFVFNDGNIYLSIFLTDDFDKDPGDLIATFDNNKINGTLNELLEIINSTHSSSSNQIAGISNLLNKLDNLEEE